MRKQINKKAFTLIELLIVIAIIGILFVVLVSKVDFATDKAKATGVQTDFRSFQLAFEQVSREHAGFSALGWDIGDLNGDRIRNSYDEGDDDQDGIVDEDETWTGHKVPGETWTEVYTLVNPNNYKDASGFKLLEDKINANLDPVLHITIIPDVDADLNFTGTAKVSMANAAKDPWKNEYHGVYLTNAIVDNGADRGAFVLYSNGANGQWGSEHSISEGVVTVTVPGNNVRGKDDMSIVVCYTYNSGYGETEIVTTGFSANQGFLSSNKATLDVVEVDSLPENPEPNTIYNYQGKQYKWDKVDTWVLDDDVSSEDLQALFCVDEYGNFGYSTLTFRSNGQIFKCIQACYFGSSSLGVIEVRYFTISEPNGQYATTAYVYNPNNHYGLGNGWKNEAFKTIEIIEMPNDAKILSWFYANAEQQLGWVEIK